VELKELVVGSRRTIAGTVYGTIVVLAVLTAGAKAYQGLWELGAVVTTTVVVLWVAHVYSHGLGESLDLGRRLTADELGSIARRELSIVLAGVLPLVFVLLGAVGVFEPRTAIWLAFGIGVATLCVQGFRYAALERLNATGTIVTVALNLGLALMIVALKVVVTH
jgi:hypothetical protein